MRRSRNACRACRQPRRQVTGHQIPVGGGDDRRDLTLQDLPALPGRDPHAAPFKQPAPVADGQQAWIAGDARRDKALFQRPDRSSLLSLSSTLEAKPTSGWRARTSVTAAEPARPVSMMKKSRASLKSSCERPILGMPAVPGKQTSAVRSVTQCWLCDKSVSQCMPTNSNGGCAASRASSCSCWGSKDLLATPAAAITRCCSS
jgi:hypothetical protein